MAPVIKMTKDIVLALLKKTPGYFSGEEMSRALGVSRSAVHAAVEALRKDGYQIDSATNRGYRLNGSPGTLNAGEILGWLPEGRGRVVFLDTVDSTNSYLSRNPDVPDGTAVVAAQQTGGRGRLGRTFLSPRDSGLYFSMLMRPDSPPADLVNITAWVAVAACDAVEAVCGVRPGIKWINDLVLKGRKICGILNELSIEAESGRTRYLVAGIGINANQRQADFPNELQNTATSVFAATGKAVDRGRLAGALINRLDLLASDWPHEKAAYLKAYRRDCVTVGKEIRILQNGCDTSAFAEGIDGDFGLIVRYSDGRRDVLRSGEVSLRGMDGYI